MKHYILVASGKLAQFEVDVTEWLNDGWQLHGPPTAVVQDGGIVFLQALTATDEDDEEASNGAAGVPRGAGGGG